MADRKTWEKRVAAWRASGMTCREYAESEGLGAWRTLRYWAWRLEREQQAKKPQLVRVVREPEAIVVEPNASDEIEMRLVISREAVRLEVASKDLVRVLDGIAIAMRASVASKAST
jgi:hypothetical protein